MTASEPVRGGYRTAVRWGLLLAGVITAAMRAPELYRFWIQWHALDGVNDPAAHSYRTYLFVEGCITLFVLGLAVTFFYLLEPRQKQAR